MRKRMSLIIVILTILPTIAFGVRSYPDPVNVSLPDGTSLAIRIFGDETFSYKTTLDGYVVAQGADGYYYYVKYEAGIQIISDRRVTSSSKEGFTKSVPLRNVEQRMLYRTVDMQSIVLTKADFNIKTIVIPVQFSNIKFTSASIRSDIFNLFNQLNYSDNGATGSVRDYFRDNLGSVCNFTFDVCNVVTLPQSHSYYGGNSTTGTDANIKELVAQACSLADADGVNFANYDYDNDGIVDNVFIIFAGYNEAEGGGDNTIWPQSWNISGSQIYFDGKKIANFSCYSEFSGASGKTPAGIGTIAHEYCHFLGLLDMYDVNGETEGLSKGLFGPISIMDRGNYNNGGKTPPYLNIIERELIGVTYMTPLRSEQHQLEILPVYSVSLGYRLMTSYSQENFYIEYRDGTKWDKYIGGDGLVVYHVDKTTNFTGSMSAAMRWRTNAVNACLAHQCAMIIPSNGGEMTDVSQAFFPGTGNVSAIHSAETFPLKDWSGNGVGYGLTGIIKGSKGMLINVVQDNTWNLPVIIGYSIEPNQTTAKLQWTVDKTSTGYWNVVWKQDIDIQADTVVVYGNSYDFTNLKSGSNYDCLLYYVLGSQKGKIFTMPFQTMKMVSEFPLIAGMDKNYKVGDELRLNILNMVEETDSITWTINGIQCPELIFPFEQAGIYIVMAEIQYIDGSVEILRKRLSVTLN